MRPRPCRSKAVMVRRAVVLAAFLLFAAAAHAEPLPETPLTQDPLGPMHDVTATAADYQPRDAFCVKTDVFQYPGPGAAAAFTGTDADCAASGFTGNDGGLVKITVGAPPLCGGCRRLFIDFSAIPANAGAVLYAHGHAYFHIASLNPATTVEPEAHSPNIKNFANDKLFVPDDSPQRDGVYAFDTYSRAYTGNTAHFVHHEVQGPYYTGPWYVNRDGVRVQGAYVDVQLVPEDPSPAEIRQLGYGAAFHSGEPVCFDEIIGGMFGDGFRDGDGYYGGCIDGFGAARSTVGV